MLELIFISTLSELIVICQRRLAENPQFLSVVYSGKYCIVVSRLKPGDRFQPMIIGYF
jgi:hypothetical protein